MTSVHATSVREIPDLGGSTQPFSPGTSSRPDDAGPSNRVIRRCYPPGYQPHLPTAALRPLGRDTAKRNRQAQFANDPNLREVKPDDACHRCRSGGWRCFANVDPWTSKKRCETCGTNVCTFTETPRDRVTYNIEEVSDASSASYHRDQGYTKADTSRLSTPPCSRPSTSLHSHVPPVTFPLAGNPHSAVIEIDVLNSRIDEAQEDHAASTLAPTSGLDTLANALFPPSEAREPHTALALSPTLFSPELPDVPNEDERCGSAVEAADPAINAEMDVDEYAQAGSHDIEMVNIPPQPPTVRPLDQISLPTPSKSSTSRPDHLYVYRDPIPDRASQMDIFSSAQVTPSTGTGLLPLGNTFTFVAPRSGTVKAKGDNWLTSKEADRHRVFRLPLRHTLSKPPDAANRWTTKGISDPRPLFIEEDGFEILDVGALTLQ